MPTGRGGGTGGRDRAWDSRPETRGSVTQGGPEGPSLHSLVKIREEVDPERVLLVQLVAVGVLDGVHGVGGRGVLQEDVPEEERGASPPGGALGPDPLPLHPN